MSIILKGKSLKIAGAAVIIMVLLFAGIIYYSDSIYKPVASGKDIKNVEIEIKPGSSISQVADILHDDGLIRNKLLFAFYVKTSGYNGRLKAGKYMLSTGMNAEEIAKKIADGDIYRDTVRITIPEGYTASDIAAAFQKAGLMSSSKFLDAAKNGTFDFDFLKNVPEKRPSRLEGYLFPDTYEFSRKSSAQQDISKMLSRFNEMFTPGMKKEAAARGMTVDQVIIVASMIEKEAKVPSERPMIAAVIYNRLKIKMKLQIDATVEYSLGKWKKSLSSDDLKVDSPYNTYKVSGLPAGPISNPGMASIKAALNPDKVDYLFYVLKKNGNGAHVFSNTFAEHEEAIAQNR